MSLHEITVNILILLGKQKLKESKLLAHSHIGGPDFEAVSG